MNPYFVAVASAFLACGGVLCLRLIFRWLDRRGL